MPNFSVRNKKYLQSLTILKHLNLRKNLGFTQRITLQFDKSFDNTNMIRILPKILLLCLLISLLVGCEVPEVEEEAESGVSSSESYSLNEDEQLDLPQKEIAEDWDNKAISQPRHGSVTETDNEFQYIPFVDFSGEDSFQIEYLKDGAVVHTRNISLTINPINDVPSASDDNATAISQAIVSIDVLANDLDVDPGDTITLESVSVSSNGSASIQNGKISYQSHPGFSGNETLTYTIEDSAGLTAEATLTINVVFASSQGEGTDLPVIPVRIAFIEKSDGTTLTDDYLSYAQNIISQLNQTYTHGEDQQLKFVLDIYDGIVNDDYFDTPSADIIPALHYFRINHNIPGKVNLYFVDRLQGGVAGIAYVNQVGTTAGMFEKMPTPALEKNVVGHEVGHNVGFYHTADDEIEEDRMINYTRCNPTISYFQKSETNHTLNSLSTNGWGHGANLMYPIASPSPSSLFTGKYDDAFSDIMACWHEKSNWPLDSI